MTPAPSEKPFVSSTTEFSDQSPRVMDQECPTRVTSNDLLQDEDVLRSVLLSAPSTSNGRAAQSFPLTHAVNDKPIHLRRAPANRKCQHHASSDGGSSFDRQPILSTQYFPRSNATPITFLFTTQYPGHLYFGASQQLGY